MWTWIIQIVLSIIILWIGHSIWNYILHNFSKEKTRDLVNIHTEKYKTIINELSQQIQYKPDENADAEILNAEILNTEILNAEILKQDLENFINEMI
jgi:hypothetical protein